MLLPAILIDLELPDYATVIFLQAFTLDSLFQNSPIHLPLSHRTSVDSTFSQKALGNCIPYLWVLTVLCAHPSMELMCTTCVCLLVLLASPVSSLRERPISWTLLLSPEPIAGSGTWDVLKSKLNEWMDRLESITCLSFLPPYISSFLPSSLSPPSFPVNHSTSIHCWLYEREGGYKDGLCYLPGTHSIMVSRLWDNLK